MLKACASGHSDCSHCVNAASAACAHGVAAQMRKAIRIEAMRIIIVPGLVPSIYIFESPIG
jgi:hypothetical protein